jgi:hypothetical protein
LLCFALRRTLIDPTQGKPQISRFILTLEVFRLRVKTSIELPHRWCRKSLLIGINGK